MKDLGEADTILGIRIYRDRSRQLLGLSQEKYINKVLKLFSMENSKKENIPLQHGVVLSKKDCPSTKEQREYMSKVPYGCRLYHVRHVMY